MAKKSKKTDKQKRILPSLKNIQPAPLLTKEQAVLQEMFSGNDNWGTGQNLPEINGVLISGSGLIKNEDYGETGSLFGIRRK